MGRTETPEGSVPCEGLKMPTIRIIRVIRTLNNDFMRFLRVFACADTKTGILYAIGGRLQAFASNIV